jgi:hypothetical protein
MLLWGQRNWYIIGVYVETPFVTRKRDGFHTLSPNGGFIFHKMTIIGYEPTKLGTIVEPHDASVVFGFKANVYEVL